MDSIPIELKAEIISLLPNIKELINASLVCKQWCTIVSEPYSVCWRAAVWRDFGEHALTDNEEDKPWKVHYKELAEKYVLLILSFHGCLSNESQST